MQAEKAAVKEEKYFQAYQDLWPVDKAINSISSCFVRFISSKSDFFTVRITKSRHIGLPVSCIQYFHNVMHKCLIITICEIKVLTGSIFPCLFNRTVIAGAVLQKKLGH